MAVTTKTRSIMAAVTFTMLFISLIYPAKLEINYIKPDFILIFIILIALTYDFKTILYTSIFAALVRDLIEFRFPGPYITVYVILVLSIYFAGSFFYRPGMIINLIFIIIFTLAHDLLWVFLYNAYYLFKFSMMTDLSIGVTIRYGTSYHVIQNVVFGSMMYYALIYVKRRLADEKR